ncbi:MAG: DUF1080 domain-containing protein [Planctomycetaceae bacterium]|jgi:hypothetical protein|nr:DUF1080 domain-containing protein [Planctomycetaceae bacterium]
MTRGEVSVEMFVPKSAADTYRNAGIILKTNDVGIGADAFVGYEIAVCPEGKHVNVGLHRNNYAPLERPACDVVADKWCTLHVSFDENSFEIKLDGKPVTKFTDKSRDVIRSGGIGLRAWQRHLDGETDRAGLFDSYHRTRESRP